MCPIVNLNFCVGLYEKYLAIRKRFNADMFFEEPQGVIRIRTTSSEVVSRFWVALGFKEPLLCYVFSNMPEYRDMLLVMRDGLTAEELGNVHVYNAETGEFGPLVFDSDAEPVLLAIHAKPSPVLEKKLLSVFSNSGDTEVEDDEYGRESRTRTRDDAIKDHQIPTVHNYVMRPHAADIKFDDFEQEYLRQIEEQEQKRRKEKRQQTQRQSKKTTKSRNNRGSRT